MNRRPGRRPLRFAAAALWSPKSISGLKLWLRADLGVTIATGVSAWADQSGTGDANKNVAQATGSKQPTLNATDAAYNNKPTLSFSAAASQNLASGTWGTPVAQPSTWFLVGNDDGVNAAQWAIEGNISGALRSILGKVIITGNKYATYGAGLGTDVAGGTLTTSPQVLGGLHNGASSNLYISAKTPVTTAAVDATANISATTIGSSFAAGSFWNGKIAEVVIYSKALSAAEISLLLGYFGSRYAITIGA